MELQVNNIDKGSVSKLQVSDVFASEFNEGLVHQAVTAYMAGGRAGTKAQKSRSEVQGGGRKPWRQKGTGRARAGTIRSPLWRSGGVTFAAKNRDYSQKINKKMYRKALAAIFAELLRQERLIVVDELVLAQPKTRDLVAVLKNMQLKAALIVLAEDDRNLALAARNMVNTVVLSVHQIDPVSLIAAEKVLITAAAIKKLEERLV